MRHSLTLVLMVAALPAAAQQAAHTISPGMSRAQVVTALGEPLTSRDLDEFTYIFYHNDCGKTCGMNDIVILRKDSVVDAVLRSPDRHYTGKSSSPVSIPPRVAAHLKAGEAPPAMIPPPTGTKPAASSKAPVKAVAPPPRKETAAPVKSPAAAPGKPAPAPSRAATVPAKSAAGTATSNSSAAKTTVKADTAKPKTPMRPAPATDTKPSIPNKTQPLAPAPKKP